MKLIGVDDDIMLGTAFEHFLHGIFELSSAQPLCLKMLNENGYGKLLS